MSPMLNTEVHKLVQRFREGKAPLRSLSAGLNKLAHDLLGADNDGFGPLATAAILGHLLRKEYPEAVACITDGVNAIRRRP